MLRFALIALAPPVEPGVWLKSPPRPGTVLTAPLDVTGETRALEGVLKVEMYVVDGAAVRLVSTYRPALPVGTVPFAFRWDPAGTRAGTVTVRVVATTALRGFSAEAPGLVVPARPARRIVARVDVPRPAVARPVAPAPATPARRVVDDSGRAFGAAAPVLPYVRAAVPPPPRPVPLTVAAPEPLPPERSGWASVAAGLLLLVTCSHLHRALRSQPDPRDGP